MAIGKVDSYAAEQRAILRRLDERWRLSGVSITPVAWPNASYEPEEVAYIEPRITRQDAFNAAFSANDKWIRHPGLLTINVYVPLGEGDADVYDLADRAVAIFRNVRIDSITFRAPAVRDLGPEGPWYRVQVDCPYWRDSLHEHAE